MELRFDMIVYSKLCNKNPAAGHIKCSHGPRLARGSLVPHSCFKSKYAIKCFQFTNVWYISKRLTIYANDWYAINRTTFFTCEWLWFVIPGFHFYLRF